MIIIPQKNEDAVSNVVKFFKEGKIVAIPTDTIYGLAVDAMNSKAVEDLYNLKKRDRGKPIAIFVKNLEVARELFFFDDLALEIAQKFFPGKITMVLKTKPGVLRMLAENLNSNQDGFLGFRIIDSFFVKKLFLNYSGIIAVTSANQSGKEPAKSVQDIQNYFRNIDMIIDGEILDSSPSTVVKIFKNKLSIIRQGALELSEYEN